MNPKNIVRKVLPKSAIKKAESTYRKSRGAVWQIKYGFPGKNLKIIAITGTNGKTTTASYINSVLQAGGLKTAVYTTAYYEIDGNRVPNRSHMTVTSQKSAQEFFAKANAAMVDYVILEITSHALDQGRISGVKAEVAVMTNLTQEHLDFHGTMQRYADAKAILFGPKWAAKHVILNRDDEWYEFFAKKSVGKITSYGEKSPSDIKLQSAKSSESGSEFTLRQEGKELRLETQLIGKFNIYNAMAAVGVGRVVGLSDRQVAKGIANLTSVPGRMEQIVEGQNFTVLVDFAITPDALENALSTLRPLTKGKLRIVFGATGDRDRTKRPQMGEVVARLADAIYLTDDETYTEDPTTIRKEVFKGILDAKGDKKTYVFDDRLEAIKAAFRDSRKGDTVLLTGIGHEDYRNMGGKKLPWDERQVARKLLK